MSDAIIIINNISLTVWLLSTEMKGNVSEVVTSNSIRKTSRFETL